MITTNHPLNYSNLVEDKIMHQYFWYMSSFLDVMVIDKNNLNQDIFNCLFYLFFPIFSESNIKEKIEYFDFKAYLINSSRNKNKLFLTFNKTPKIIYFANNSNAKLKFKNKTIDLNNKKGSSIFVENISNVEITKFDNTQTCIIILDLKSKIKQDFKYQ